MTEIRIKRLILIISVLVLSLSLIACSPNPAPANNEPEPETLNSRQKQILNQVGLSDDPAQLEYSQLESIKEIEAGLVYLETKYPDVIFEYAGYYDGSLFDEHELIATASTLGFDEYVIVSFSDADIPVNDNYIHQLSKPYISEYFYSALREITNTLDIKIFVPTVYQNNLTEIPKEYSEFDGNIEVDLMIYLDSHKHSPDQAEQYSNELLGFMLQHKISGNYQIICNTNYSEINSYNLYDYLRPEYVTARVSGYLNESDLD